MSLRSIKEWAFCAEAQLATLRAELWQVLKSVKKGDDENPALGWAELAEHCQAGGEQESRAIEARWRRALKPDIDEEPVIGQVLYALHKVKERIPKGEYSRVRRILYEEEDPFERMGKIFYPGATSEQNVSGLKGFWRLVHQRSDGNGFLSWSIKVCTSIEPYGGPGAWFEMETFVPVSGSYNSDQIVSEKVTGAIHSSGALFSFIGADEEKRLVTGSFQSSGGQVPANKFQRAYGLIQRIGSRGLYSSRAILSKVDEPDHKDIGSFPIDVDNSIASKGLVEDIKTLSSSSSNSRDKAYLLSLLSTNDIYGT